MCIRDSYYYSAWNGREFVYCLINLGFPVVYSSKPETPRFGRIQINDGLRLNDVLCVSSLERRVIIRENGKFYSLSYGEEGLKELIRKGKHDDDFGWTHFAFAEANHMISVCGFRAK
eukprot:TRINITY_DN29141_c0_g1_i1.p1 TRINITY_DN29141_c0_g1~~TRINITY_DN29141_c0_g1_i1.p1  ORF type:complete len:134 (-),score=20.73 TRINITY_DN29141_c0_g1_i1:29-379(-)